MANWGGTGIRWTDETWNPVHGCSKTSEGCLNCYAERVSRRFNHTPEDWTPENAEANVNVKPEKLDDLDSLPGPRWVFVNSMSDLLHPLVPDDFVEEVLARCGAQEESCFQVLTKHGADDPRDIEVSVPRNVMLGVSVESPRRTYRIDWLREQDATTRFISFEPLVERIGEVDLSGIDWAIIGGESGPAKARREMDPVWARELVTQCGLQDVPVFFKQHSGDGPESRIRLDLGSGPELIEDFPDLPEGVVPTPREFLEEVEDAV